MGKPDEVAKVLCFLLTDDASYVTGCKCRVSAFATQRLLQLADKSLAHWTVDGGYSAC